MESENPKKQKKHEDIISTMPDDVLVHILSRLEHTVDAVKTCVLSSRWKNLWKLVDCIRLYYRHDEVEQDSLLIDRILAVLQSKNIQSFYLHATCSSWNHVGDHIDKWLAYAAEHNVSELKLYIREIYGGNFITLPLCIVNCESLVSLTLDYHHFGFNIPKSKVCFPNVKSLYIICCLCYHEDAGVDKLPEILHSFPAIENLTVKFTKQSKFGKTYEIILPNLRTLHLYGEESYRGYAPNKYIIKAHKLEYMYIHESINMSSFILYEAPFLSKVSVNYVGWHNLDYFNGIRYLTGFMNVIKNVKSLALSPSSARVLSYACDGNILKFPNLIHLELGIESEYGWKLLPHFLMNSPFLQSLHLTRNNYLHGRGNFDFVFFDLEDVPICLLLELKKFSFKNMKGNFDELDVIGYILKHSRVLESFFISIRNGGSTKVKKIKDFILQFFPKSSPLCEVQCVQEKHTPWR